MTVPKWLIPVLALVAALGVAVAASLFAVRFAPPVASPVDAPVVENIPVIQPVDDPDAAFPAETDAGLEVSPATGSTDVVVPESGSDVLLDELTAEADAIAVGSMIPLDDDAPRDDGPTGEERPGEPPLADPCDTDPEAEGCSDGVMSTVLALTAPPPFAVELTPLDSCGDVARDGFPFIWRSTQPASFTVQVVQSDPDAGIFGLPLPDTRVFSTTLVTTAQQNADWDAAREAEAPRLPGLGGCAWIEGLDPATYYTFEVTGVSRDGEIIARTYEFLGDGDFARRGMVIAAAPGSGGGWTASLVHVAAEQFAVRLYSIPLDTLDPATCSVAEDNPDRYPEIDVAYRTTGTLSATRTAALGVPREQNRNTVSAFVVPQGARLLFCGALYHGPDSPSFERETPLRTYAQFARSASWSLPRITLSDAELFRDDVVVHLSAATGDGYTCGNATIEAGQDVALEPLLLCLLEHFGPRYRPGGGFDDAIDPWDQHVTVAIRATVELPGGEELRSSQALDLLICSWVRAGECDRRLGDRVERYDLTLPAERVASGLCGSSFGADCTPPTREDATGVIRLTVDWPGGRVATDGVFGVIPEDRTPDARAPEPQLDTGQRIFSDEFDPETGSAIAALNLITDREADYRVELRALPGLDPCTVGGATLVAEGRTAGDTRVEIPGACFGARYLTRVTLTDGDQESVWGLGDAHPWLGGLLQVPDLEGQVTVTAFHGETEPASMLQRFSLELDGQDLGLTAAGGTCVADGNIDGTAVAEVGVSSRPELAFDIVVRETRAEAFGVCSGGDEREATFRASMFLDTAELIRHPEGFDYAIGPYSFHLAFSPLE